jgi:hypothetical protein
MSHLVKTVKKINNLFIVFLLFYTVFKRVKKINNFFIGLNRVARVLRHDSVKTQLALGHFRTLFPDVRPLFVHSLFTF